MARYDKDYVAFNRSGLAHTYAKCFVCLFYSHSVVADLQTLIDKGLQARK